ncbi:hypothetical protein ACEQ8H_001084 [Pleosporales sp. CAS-2024a]
MTEFPKFSSFTTDRHITLSPLSTQVAERDRDRPSHLPSHFIRTPYPFTAKKVFPQPKSRPRHRTATEPSDSGGPASPSLDRPDSGYDDNESHKEYDDRKGKHVLGLAGSAGHYDVRSRLERNEDAQGLIRNGADSGGESLDSTIWLSLVCKPAQQPASDSGTPRLVKITVPNSLTASSRSKEKHGKGPPATAVEFDDQFLADRLRDAYRSLTGSWLLRCLGARTLQDVRLAQINTWSGSTSQPTTHAWGLLAAGAGIDTDADAPSPFTESSLMTLYRRPSTGKARYTWVHWAQRVAATNQSTQQRRPPKPSSSSLSDKMAFRFPEPRRAAAAAAAASSEHALLPHTITTIQFVQRYSALRILSALALMLLVSVAAALLWVFLGADAGIMGQTSSQPVQQSHPRYAGPTADDVLASQQLAEEDALSSPFTSPPSRLWASSPPNSNWHMARRKGPHDAIVLQHVDMARPSSQSATDALNSTTPRQRGVRESFGKLVTLGWDATLHPEKQRADQAQCSQGTVDAPITAAERELNKVRDMNYPPELRENGKFTDDEEEIIRRAIQHYQESTGDSVDDLVDTIQWSAEESHILRPCNQAEWTTEDIENEAKSRAFWKEIQHTNPPLKRPWELVKRHVQSKYHAFQSGPWTREEDEEIERGMLAYPEEWKAISIVMGDRSASDIHGRWNYHLQHRDPRSDEPWTAEEEDALLEALIKVMQEDEDHRAETASPAIAEYTNKDIDWDAVCEAMGNIRSQCHCSVKWVQMKKCQKSANVRPVYKAGRIAQSDSQSLLLLPGTAGTNRDDGVPQKRKRGRPRKSDSGLLKVPARLNLVPSHLHCQSTAGDKTTDDGVLIPLGVGEDGALSPDGIVASRPRGRPRKSEHAAPRQQQNGFGGGASCDTADLGVNHSAARGPNGSAAPRKRGRPRKHDVSHMSDCTPQRKRGRPRKSESLLGPDRDGDSEAATLSEADHVSPVDGVGQDLARHEACHEAEIAVVPLATSAARESADDGHMVAQASPSYDQMKWGDKMEVVEALCNLDYTHRHDIRWREVSYLMTNPWPDVVMEMVLEELLRLVPQQQPFGQMSTSIREYLQTRIDANKLKEYFDGSTVSGPRKTGSMSSVGRLQASLSRLDSSEARPLREWFPYMGVSSKKKRQKKKRRHGGLEA